MWGTVWENVLAPPRRRRAAAPAAVRRPLCRHPLRRLLLHAADRAQGGGRRHQLPEGLHYQGRRAQQPTPLRPTARQASRRIRRGQTGDVSTSIGFRETVPEPFSYLARRFLHARDRQRHQRLHSSGIRHGIRCGTRGGICNTSGHRLRGWTSDLSSQPRPELGGSPVEIRFVSLRVYLCTCGQYTCTYPLYKHVCNPE
jgi:hypothetical protein